MAFLGQPIGGCCRRQETDTVPLFRKEKAPLCGIYSEKEFHALIEHERRRADRTGVQFSVVLFDVSDQQEATDNLCLLQELVVNSTRSTDVTGWFDSHHMGVLLIDTPRNGACEFVNKLLQRLPPGQRADHHILTYPSKDSKHFSPVDSIEPGTKDPHRFQQINLFEPQTIQAVAEVPHCHTFSAENPSEMHRGGCFQMHVSGLDPHLGTRIPVWKRAFDLALAILALIVLSPLLLCTALMIKSLSPGPVLFRQERIGYLGRPFKLLKFRTMKVNTDTSAHEDYVRGLIRGESVMKKLDHDSELVPFGKFLRNSGIDELPQLFHVLTGTMSLVGPRPCLPVEFEEYLHWHRRRFYTLPGITGLWQVNGKNEVTFEEMIRQDIRYEQKRSFKVDLQITWRTLPALMKLMRDG